MGIIITVPIPLNRSTYPKVVAVSKAVSRTSGTRDAQVAKARPRLKSAKLTAKIDFLCVSKGMPIE
jgi:hypothetical protein